MAESLIKKHLGRPDYNNVHFVGSIGNFTSDGDYIMIVNFILTNGGGLVINDTNLIYYNPPALTDTSKGQYVYTTIISRGDEVGFYFEVASDANNCNYHLIPLI